MSIRAGALITAALVALPIAAGAQRTEQTSDFTWGEQISAGNWLRASNVNGKVTIRQGTGDRVELTAVKRWRRGDPASVRIDARKVGGDIEICALYDEQRTCDEKRDDRGWRRNRDDDNNDVSVDFTILVPRGVKIRGATVNGSVDISGATTDVDAASVNGSVSVETGGGPLRATTVNGTVYARIAGVTADHPMTFTTVNGNIVAELPANVGADVDMTTVNGTLKSDFDITIRGRIDPHNLSVHVGAPGGPRIRLTTVNGNVELRRR